MLVLIFRRLNKILIAIVLSVNLFCCGSIYHARALDSLPAIGSDQAPGSQSSMTTVKPESSSVQQSNLNLQQLPSLIDIPQTSESIEKVYKLEEEGEKYYHQHLLDKALAKWQECYGSSLEMKYAEGEGRALTNMGRVFIDRGQFVKAKYMGENAIEVLSTVSDKKALGRAHLYLAQAYFGLDNPVWAGEQLDLALKSFTADGGNNAADTAKLMNLAASIILQGGKLKEALQFLQASAMYYGQAGDNANAIASRIRVVNVLLALGLYTAAQEETEKAISVARTAPDQLPNLCAALACLANCKFSFGEYGEAKKTYLQVLSYAKKFKSDQLNAFGRANLYLGYGTTLAALNEYAAAKEALDFALPVFKAAGASLPQAQTANTLGLIEWQLGHKERALELLQQALDLHNLITPKQEYFRNTVLQNLAALQSRLGDNRQARSNLDLAVSNEKKSKDNTGLGRTYLALTEVMLKLSEQTEAENYLNSAIQVSQESGDDSALWQEYTLLAKMQVAQANEKGARESLMSATSFLRSPQSGEFASPEHIYYPSERKEVAYVLVQLLVQQKLVDEALVVSDQLKQEAFLANWKDLGASLAGTDAELYKDLSLQRIHLHATEVISAPGKATKQWQNWLARFRALSQQNKQVARLIAPVPIAIADLNRTLDASHSTILDYVVGKDSSIVFTIKAGGKITATNLNIGDKQFVGLINSLLPCFGPNSNAADNASVNKVLHSLYGALLPESVRNALSQNADDLLMIIPDGPLDALPFNALIDNQNKFLVSSHTISLSPALANLIDSPPRYTDSPSFLFCAGAANPGEQIDNIAQAKDIAQALPPNAVTYLIGEEANLKNLQEQGNGKGSVQICGGVDLSGNALNNALPLKAKDEQSEAKASDLFAISLSCDAAVLNGGEVKKIEEQARNFMQAPSTIACAFRYAGARHVVVSLWQTSGNQEMSDLYKAQLSGVSPIVALRKAELAQIARNIYPGDWASLQIFGPMY